MRRRFTISEDAIAPPLTFGETVRKYGVPKAEVKRGRKFLEHATGEKSTRHRSRKSAGGRVLDRKTRRRRVLSKRSR
jgi:hypothetical protein